MLPRHEYRKDVDGLRAIAVASVILYHLKLFSTADLPFSGGFVGVDVFFVISGYLIAGIIDGRMAKGEFSLGPFFAARARRICPALYATLLLVCGAAYLFYLPADMQNFGKALVSATLFMSNFLFMTQTGYFDADPQASPLLHTWSLAVEWQFYLLLPLIMLSLPDSTVRNRVLQALFVLSLVLCLWVTQRDQQTAFYATPLRMWEFLAGAAVALRWLRLPAGLAVPAAVLGLGLILGSALGYSEQTPFPGAAAMAPVLGACLLIAAGSHANIVSGGLSTTPIRFIGWVSYSLYLVHWPILVFATYYLGRKLGGAEAAAAVAAMVALATLSWWIVERPWRTRRITGRAVVVSAGAVAAVIAVTGGAAAVAGFPWRFPDLARSYAEGAKDLNPDLARCANKPVQDVRDGRICRLGPEGAPVFLVWGDSHADALMPAFKGMAVEEAVPGAIAARGGCPALLGVDRVGLAEAEYPCRATGEAVVDFMTRSKIKTVIMVSTWDDYAEGAPLADDETKVETAPADINREGAEAFRRAFAKTIRTLAAAGVNVWVVQQVPHPRIEVPAKLSEIAVAGGDAERLTVDRGAISGSHREVQALLKELGAKSIDPFETFCTSTQCRVAWKGHALYRDKSHTTAFAASWSASMLTPIFAEIGSENGS